MPFNSVHEVKQSKPIFMIPDITGLPTSLESLITELQNRLPKRQIYAWTDPRHADAGGPEYLSVDNLAKIISSDIIKILDKFNTKEVDMAGYSFGGTLAAAVGKELIKEGYCVRSCIFDCPSPELSKQHLRSNNPAATKDLVAIFRYIADITECDLDFGAFENEKHLGEVCKNTVSTQIKSIYLASSIGRLNSDNNDNFELYTKRSKIAANNLIALCHYEPKAEKIADELRVCMTIATCKKYNCESSAGWETHATGRLIIEKKPLPGDHQTFLTAGKTYPAAIIKEMCSAPIKSLSNGTEFKLLAALSAPKAASPTPKVETKPINIISKLTKSMGQTFERKPGEIAAATSPDYSPWDNSPPSSPEKAFDEDGDIIMIIPGDKNHDNNSDSSRDASPRSPTDRSGNAKENDNDAAEYATSFTGKIFKTRSHAMLTQKILFQGAGAGSRSRICYRG